MGEVGAAHQVTLTQPFYMGVHEVTQAQYEQVMGTNPSRFAYGNNPVEQVSWNDAVSFCRRLSALPKEKAAGRVYRLPTEAEWEYACRAGAATEYSFGDDETQLSQYGWFHSNSDGRTHPIGQKRTNGWGLHDMHGNVWEWCSDWYGEYPSGTMTDPRGPHSGSRRVRRGGCWNGPAGGCRSADRYYCAPGYSSLNLGFRVALIPPAAGGE
jgi:formylglycine-generating enzyme required for sulfatase activity